MKENTWQEWIRAGLKNRFPFNLFTSHYQLFGMQARSAEFKIIGDLVHSGKLKVTIQEYLPFTEESIMKGFETLKSHRVRGKLLVKI